MDNYNGKKTAFHVKMAMQKTSADISEAQRIAKMRALKEEVSRKASMANKRLERLERNNLQDLPAYKQWVKDGEVRFGVRGKNWNELQSELGRLNRFIDAKTSTVRSSNQYLKEVAERTGVSYTSVKELPVKLQSFFELSSKIEQYLRNVEGSASAIGYHKIWEVVNEYVDDEENEIGLANMDIDDALDALLELVEYEKEDELRNALIRNSDWTKIQW